MLTLLLAGLAETRATEAFGIQKQQPKQQEAWKQQADKAKVSAIDCEREGASACAAAFGCARERAGACAMVEARDTPFAAACAGADKDCKGTAGAQHHQRQRPRREASSSAQPTSALVALLG